MQILDSLNSVEKSINKKINDLQALGVENYVNKQIKQAQKRKTKPTVSYPENTDALGANVMSVSEVKTAKPRKPKYTPLPIATHESESKAKKRKKK